jgi:hypothetical protein
MMETDGALLGAIKHCTDGLNAVDGTTSAAATLQELHRVATRVAAVLEREPQARGTYYLGYEHPAMQRMVEADRDPGRTTAAWHHVDTALVELRAAIRAVDGRTRLPEAARAQFARIGDWIDDTGRAVRAAAGQMTARSEAAARARSAMPKPVEFSMNAAIGVLERETDPVNLRRVIDEINQRFEDKQRAHERAAQVMADFAETVRDAGPGLPRLAPVPALRPAQPTANGHRPRAGAALPGEQGVMAPPGPGAQ